MPEEQALEDVAGHQGLRSKDRGEPTAEVGKPQANRLEKRTLESYSRIPPSRRQIAVENDQTLVEISYSITPCSHRVNRSLRLWESRSLRRQSGGSVSAGD
jgi:hypothetical protein